jgi:hypothetical protein
MVTMAKRNTDLQRASYLEIDSARMPQAIAALLPQVLARYSIAPEVPNQVEMEDREYEGEEDVHTLAATGTLGS